MTDRKFFGTTALVEGYIKDLEKIEVLNGGLSVIYLDKASDQKWLKYCVSQDPMPQHFNLMQIYPALTTEEIMEIAFTSLYGDEIHAAARRLSEEEISDKKEYREQLLLKLQRSAANKDLTIMDKARLETIIRSALLLDTFNQREIIGKRNQEIERDAAFFKDIAAKSRLIIAQLYPERK